VKVIYPGAEVSQKEGKKKLSVICIEVVVKGTRGNEGAERSGVHDEEQRTKDRRCPLTAGDVCLEDRSVSHLTRTQRDDRYDLNQLRTEPWIASQDDRRVIKMSWSIVSKAAERSRRQRHDTFCDPIALMR